ncbi:MAG TPA: isoprenylcysteine carboxylmethyltransferase family protein [Nitrospiria bacterium]|jgi:protein-S-isoprenylcysteine O-methyltransferase Ste14|nr:isoprenylcysteine carboxylmethyltransferase family protein [Nitrospiria bacterium]
MRSENGEHPFSHIGQLTCLTMFLIVWGGDSFILHRSTFLSNFVPLPVRLGFLGLALAVAVYLVRSGHVVVRPEERPSGVITTGAFKYVRHPIYLGSLLTYLGFAISTGSILSLALVAGIFIFHDYIASYEEERLEARFGEEYGRYKRRTGKWIPTVPFVSRKN